MGHEGGGCAFGHRPGGRYYLQANTETPDTLMTIFEYPGLLVRYSVRQANSRRVEGRRNADQEAPPSLDLAPCLGTEESGKRVALLDIPREGAYIRQGNV